MSARVSYYAFYPSFVSQPGIFLLGADAGIYVLTGSAALLSASLLFASDPGVYVLVGQPDGINVGLQAVVGTYALVGSPTRPDINVPINPGVYSLIGIDERPTLAYSTGVGAYLITGGDASLARDTIMRLHASAVPSVLVVFEATPPLRVECVVRPSILVELT